MKNLKKVLALVLAFACAFTMMAGAVVYPDVPAGSEYSEAITMLSDLGVITGDTDGKYHPENTITRAEACALIARLLTGETDVSKYQGASNFPDVAKTSWYESAVGYCVANGIVRGYPDGTFRPAVQITDAEFVTMLVRAMGYETVSNPLSYPYGYISAAQTAGLLDDVTVVPASGALRGEDAQMLYNAMFADFARGARFINTTHGTTVEEYPTIAESVFGLTRAAVGTWDDGDDVLDVCKAHTWVITGNSIKVGDVDMIVAYPIRDGETELYAAAKEAPYVFNYDGDISALKGYQVELWGEGQHDEPEYTTAEDGTKVYAFSDDWDIKAIKTLKGQTAYAYTPADEDLPDVDYDDVNGFVGGTVIEKKFNTIKWGKSINEDDVKDALQTKNSASYNIVDWDSDGAADFIVGDLYYYYKVDAVTKKSVRLIGMNGEKFTLDQDGETDVTIGGQKYTITAEFPDDLEEGDIIEVTTENVAAKKKIESTWTVEVVEPETRELTKVDTKKGAYFDDELVYDAEKFDGVQYYFDDLNKRYDELNEKSEADWDLYLDANGFIIEMAVADEAWTGYIYVTGAADGIDKTGSKREYAEISGVNDKNEYMKNVTVVKDANVDMDIDRDGKLEDGLKDGFVFDANPKGRVFHYALNDDGDITKLEEVALDGNYDYTFTDKTDAVRVDNYNYWMDDCDVIFAVKTDDNYVGSRVWNDVTNNYVTNVYAVGEDDISHKDVVAVAIDEIPDIYKLEGGKTNSRGIRYDADDIKDESGAVVLGVDTLRFFSNTSVEAGLLTKLTYNRKDDTYTAEAYIAGREGTEFTTIDADDVLMAGDTKLDVLYDILTKGNDAKYGIYCEFEFDKDGNISALSPMSEDIHPSDLEVVNRIDETATIPYTYEVARVVVNKVTLDRALTVSSAESAVTNEASNVVYTVENAQYMTSFDIDDSTAYYKITDEKVDLPTEGSWLNPWKDGFKDGYGVEEGSADDLDSYIRNYDDKYEDEYVVADIIVDGGDVVAVYYYDKLVGEYGYLAGLLTLDEATEQYSEQPVYATVRCGDPELDPSKVYVEVDGKRVEGRLTNAVGTFTLPTLNASATPYDVEAHGWNTAAGRYQLIAETTLTVEKDEVKLEIVENDKAANSIETIPADSKVVYVKVTNTTANKGVVDLDESDFKAYNRLDLKDNIEMVEAGSVAGTYKLTLKEAVGVGSTNADLVVEYLGDVNLEDANDTVVVVVPQAKEYTYEVTVNTGDQPKGFTGEVTLSVDVNGQKYDFSVDCTDMFGKDIAKTLNAAIKSTYFEVELDEDTNTLTFTSANKLGITGTFKSTNNTTVDFGVEDITE